jgi:hypothetical protein
LATGISSTWLQLGTTSFFSAVVPIVIGGVLTVFKPLLPTEDDVKKRVDQRRQALVEGVCKLFHRVLTQAMTAGLTSLDPKSLKELRGAPPHEPDLIADHTTELFRTLAVLRELENIHSGIKRRYTCLLLTISIGVLGLLVAIPVEGARSCVAVVCYVAVGVQLYSVLSIRHLVKQLEAYERTT